LGAVDDEELPGWSDEEDGGGGETLSKQTKDQNKMEGRATTPNIEGSLSAGTEITRPQSRSQVTGRRGSSFINTKESTTTSAA
jgi:hypothetical protein